MKRIYWLIFGLLAFTGTAQAAHVTTHHCTVIETTDFTPNLSSDSPVLGVVYSTQEYYGSTFNVYVDRYGGVAVNSECPSNSVSIPAGNYSLQAMHGAVGLEGGKFKIVTTKQVGALELIGLAISWMSECISAGEIGIGQEQAFSNYVYHLVAPLAQEIN